MDKQEGFPSSEDFEFDIKDNDALFVISVVSELVHIPIWTLRKLDEMGVVRARRLGKKTRCYSKSQISQLTYIYHLMEEKGVNIQGIKIIMEMEYVKEQKDDSGH
jgi:MerR family transcriptional regulator/heat shock protein HspR